MANIAVCQTGSILGNTEATLAVLEQVCQDCRLRGVKFAVFPEAFVGGYPKGMTFGASVGIRSEAGRRLFRTYAECAVDVPGVHTEKIGRIARDADLYLVIGVVERAGGTLYCTALYFAPDGALLGKHRKLMPTAVERVIWGSGDASTLQVQDSAVGRFGALICWENYMPLARMAMYEQGVELYCAPTVDDRDSWIPTLRHIAREGRCFVLSSCQFVRRENYPPDWLAATQGLQDIAIRGGSCIIDPFGEVLAGPLYGEAGILIANLDLKSLTEARFEFDVVGHYARPDVFQFRVKNSQSHAGS